VITGQGAPEHGVLPSCLGKIPKQWMATERLLTGSDLALAQTRRLDAESSGGSIAETCNGPTETGHYRRF
jgi:hypothetical protein